MRAHIVRSAFGVGAAEYSRWARMLWDPVAEATISVSAPRSGEQVLDAYCGYGASAISAARAVGIGGHVDAIDLAPAQIRAGRTRAAAEGVRSIRFAVRSHGLGATTAT